MQTREPDEPVDVVLADLLRAQQSSEPLRQDELLKKHPELAAQIAEFLADYQSLDRELAPLRAIASGSSRSQAEMPTLGRDETDTSAVPAPGTSFGDYDLLSEIARGGMGVVYKARQRDLNRVVALKMVLGGRRDSAVDRIRFLAEARAVARLSHPHIVPIYEVGEHARQPYFTMQFVAGGSLRERQAAFREPRAAAQLVATVARAVEHAHRRGILHRDLKPSNVLVDEQGQPHVTDFGLAKNLDEESDLTQAGAIVGTPGYMAPEQAGGQSDLSTAVDVYSLGAVLYELITGRPPFKCDTPMETILQVLSKEPARPRQIAPQLEPDLESITLKCLEKNPQQRYGSAEALSDDLERWLAGEPIHARPVRFVERAVKWSRRQPLAASLLAVTGAAGVALLVAGGFLWHNAELRAEAVQDLGQAQVQLVAAQGKRKSAEKLAAQQRKLADQQHQLADEQRKLADKVKKEVNRLQTAAEDETKKALEAREQLRRAELEREAALVDARRTLYAADMQLAHVAWRGDNPALAGELLARYAKPGDEADLRSFEWHYLQRQLNSAKLSWSVADGPADQRVAVVGMATSPDGKTVATAQGSNHIKIWDFATGKLLRSIEAKDKYLTGLFFEEGGTKLTAVARKPFDPILLSKIITPAIQRKQPIQLKNLTDSLEFATWDLTNQGPAVTSPLVASRLATAVFSTFAGPVYFTHQGKIVIASSIVASADGKWLGLAGMSTSGLDSNRPGIDGGLALVWDVERNAVLGVHESAEPLTAFAFTTDGGKVAIGNVTGAIQIHGRDLNQVDATLQNHVGFVYTLRFSPDDSRLIGGAVDGRVLVWDPAKATVVAEFRGHTSAVMRAEMSPDGKAIVSGGMDGSIKIWDLKQPGDPLVLPGHATSIGSLVFSTDGRELTSADLHGVVKRHRTAGDKPLEDVLKQALPLPLRGIRISQSGNAVAWKDMTAKDTFVVYEVAARKERKFVWKDHVLLTVTLSADGKLVAADHFLGGKVSVWDVAEGTLLATLDLKSPNRAGTAGFSADSKFIMLGHVGNAAIWDWKANTTRTLEPKMAVGISSMVISPDGRQLAAATADLVRIWDVESGQARFDCRGAGQFVAAMEFSPDGRRLATAGLTTSQRSLLKLWDATSGREVFSAATPQGMLTAVTFSPDGNRLAAAFSKNDLTRALIGHNVGGEIYIWNAQPLDAELPR